MSNKFPAIPTQVAGASLSQKRHNDTVKECVELLTGKLGDSVLPLASTASLADVIQAFNNLLSLTRN